RCFFKWIACPLPNIYCYGPPLILPRCAAIMVTKDRTPHGKGGSAYETARKTEGRARQGVHAGRAGAILWPEHAGLCRVRHPVPADGLVPAADLGTGGRQPPARLLHRRCSRPAVPVSAAGP